MIPLGQTHDLIKLMAEIAQLKEEVERERARAEAAEGRLTKARRWCEDLQDRCRRGGVGAGWAELQQLSWILAADPPTPTGEANGG